MLSHLLEASPLCSPLRLLMPSCWQHIITVAEACVEEVLGKGPVVGPVVVVGIVAIRAFMAEDIILGHIILHHTVTTLYGTPIQVSGFAPTTFIDVADNYCLGRFTMYRLSGTFGNSLKKKVSLVNLSFPNRSRER